MIEKRKNAFSGTEKSTKILCVVLAAVLFTTVGCDKPPISNSEDIEGTDTNFTLQGTKWKLVGVFDVETDTLIKELDPKHCEECYTLTFDTDSTTTVFRVNKTSELNLSNLFPYVPYINDDGDTVFISIDVTIDCERYKDGKDYCDSDNFRRGIFFTKSYAFTANELILFTDYCIHSKNVYLLFKPLK